MNDYISSLLIEDIPWNRLMTMYGTAEEFPELLQIIDDMENADEVENALDDILNAIEHQSTMLEATPFAVVFLIRIYKKACAEKENSVATTIKEILEEKFEYFAEICADAENYEHAEKLPNLADLLKEEYLLPEDITEDELDDYFEDPDIVPDDLFYSIYYYTGVIIEKYFK